MRQNSVLIKSLLHCVNDRNDTCVVHGMYTFEVIKECCLENKSVIRIGVRKPASKGLWNSY